MSSDEQNVAVAEWCEYKWWKHTKSNTFIFAAPDRTKESLDGGGMEWEKCERPNPIPSHIISCGSVHDYGSDLNAMNEVEMRLGEQQYRIFIGHLVCVLIAEKPNQFSVRATAKQRLEAFVRYIGKWKD